jgi:RAB protein geranylgeranyltransferase component A
MNHVGPTTNQTTSLQIIFQKENLRRRNNIPVVLNFSIRTEGSLKLKK